MTCIAITYLYVICNAKYLEPFGMAILSSNQLAP